MKTLPALAVIAALLCVLSQPARAEIEVISGGTGEDSLASLQTLQKDYSFKAIFVGKGGEYLSEVETEITDAHDLVIAKHTTDGPILLAKLAAGSYTLRAKAGDYAKTQKFTVGPKGLKEIYVRYPLSAE